MSWNYRVLRTLEKTGNYGYSVIEVYYDESGEINGYAKARPAYGNDIDDLRDELILMRSALELPVLELKRGKPKEVK